MKKQIALIFLSVAFLLSVSSCAAPTDKVLESLGEYEKEEYYSSGGFQDFTDYAKYTYESIDLSENPYFEKITEQSKEALLSHIDDFEKWLAAITESDPDYELLSTYDFSTDIISNEDYLYIYDDPDYPELGCYDVYLFDTENATLYYFHNNI